MIEVIKPGLFTTIQDAGRWGYQAYGMPVAGAMDRYAYNMANLLVDNRDGEAVLEMTLVGGAFRFQTATWAALCGADMGAALNGEKLDNWSAFLAPPGSELTLGYAINGCRSYLAIRGGIDVPPILGSRSTYTRAGVGGSDGKALTGGCQLKIVASTTAGTRRVLPRLLLPVAGEEVELRVLPGPQHDHFTAAGLDTFFAGVYNVTTEADRMGYRLEGPQVTHLGQPDIVSDALCLGAIQIPGHGMPIVMMADRQTTGGYPKIGTVIGPDVSRLAQAKPGDRVRFRQCSDEEAVAALRTEESCYRTAAACFPAATAELPPPRHGVVRVNGQVFHIQFDER